MGGRVVGIDLGTTNSEVAALTDQGVVVLEEEGSALLPSVVALAPDGGVLVGAAALNQAVLHPDRTARSVKRLMGTSEEISLGEETFTPQEISALILGALRARAERVLGETVTGAVITVPAYFSDAQRQATREAGEIAGLEVLRVLNEPTAASLAHPVAAGADDDTGTFLVYDLGGGTFDVSIVRREQDVTEVQASHGDVHLGGDDFDEATLAYVLEQQDDAELRARTEQDPRVRARLLRAAEAARCRLSSAPHAKVREDSLWVEDGVAHHLDLEIDRHDLETRVAPLLERTMASIHRALEDAGVGVHDLDGVLLAGGATRTPAVHALIEEVTGRAPSSVLHPDTCVALGAGLVAARMEGRSDVSVLVDITPYTFGTRAVSFSGLTPDFDHFCPLIRRNTALPASSTEAFSTMHDGQQAAEVAVFQGEDEDTRKNLLVGKFRVEGLADVERGNEILIGLNLGLDGILEVTATERATGLSRGIRIEGAVGRLGNREVEAARSRVSGLLGREEMEEAAGKEEGAIGAPSHAALSKAPAEIRELADRYHRLRDRMAPEDEADAAEILEALLDPARADEREANRERMEDLLFYVGESEA